MQERKRILVLASTASETLPLRAAADKLALETIVGCSDSTGSLRLDFTTRDSALHIVEYVQQNPVVAIIPVGDSAVPSAARAASMIGLPFHSPRAADVCANKALLRTKLSAPDLVRIGISEAPGLTLDCIMTAGKLRVLAARQTSSRPIGFNTLSPDIQSLAIESLEKLIPALGLKHGPVTVEFSMDSGRLLISDVSLCYLRNDALHFRIPLVDADISYAEVIIRNALDLDTSRIHLDTE
jgi:hypothetical protein